MTVYDCLLQAMIADKTRNFGLVFKQISGLALSLYVFQSRQNPTFLPL
jgi:hypothetical protein